MDSGDEALKEFDVAESIDTDNVELDTSTSTYECTYQQEANQFLKLNTSG